MTKEYEPFIDNYGEYDEEVSGDYKAPLNELPKGKYYILRAINIETKEGAK